MALSISVVGVEVQLAASLATDFAGITLSGIAADLEIAVPFPVRYPLKYSKNNFELVMLFKKDVRENEIYQVVSRDDKRMGWLFPLQALQSNNHKYIDDDNFLTFSRIASELLFDGVEGVFRKSPRYEQGRDYRLSDFYSEHSVILLLSKSHADVVNGYDIGTYLPFFALRGFYYLTLRDPFDGVAESTIIQYDGLRLRPKAISSALRREPFVSALLTEVIPYERQALSKFFFLYQLVELLLDKVLQESYKTLASDLLKNASSTSSDYKGLIESFNEKLSEKKRINILRSQYVVNFPDEGGLRNFCNEFLRNVGVLDVSDPDIVGFADYLYRVRNTLFHNFRLVDKDAQANLEPIGAELKLLLLELLIEFQLPARMIDSEFIDAEHL